MLKGKAGYSNKRNQNPSYCDRVLWKSRPGLDADVQLEQYTGVYECNQSDHRPVAAAFTLRTRVPYVLPPEHVSSPACNFGTAHLSLLKLHFTPQAHTETALVGDEDGDDDDDEDYDDDDDEDGGGGGEGGSVGGSGRRQSGWSGFDGSSADELSPRSRSKPGGALKYAARVDSRFCDSSSMGFVTESSPGEGVDWTFEELPPMQCWVADPAWLRHQHLVVTIRASTGAVVGSAVLQLTQVAVALQQSKSTSKRSLTSPTHGGSHDNKPVESMLDANALDSVAEHGGVILFTASVITPDGVAAGSVTGRLRLMHLPSIMEKTAALQAGRKLLRGHRRSSASFMEALVVEVTGTERRADHKGAYTAYIIELK